MFDINYAKLSPTALKWLLKKRVGILAGITQDLVENKSKYRKSIGVLDSSGTSVFPEKNYWKRDAKDRSNDKALSVIFQRMDKHASTEFDKDMQKRAEQIFLIMLEMQKRKISVPRLDLTRIHPQVAKAFRAEGEKLGFEVRARVPKLLKKIKKAKPMQRRPAKM